MQNGSRFFIIGVFSICALAFWLLPLQLYLEFARNLRLADLIFHPARLFDATHNAGASSFDLFFLLLTHYADLFLFFPVFGTIALIAFFKPASLLVDMYWHADELPDHLYILYAPTRFVLTFTVLLGLSIFIANYTLSGGERTLWQLTPATLKADRGENCKQNGSCERVGFLNALSNIRTTSRDRLFLSDLARTCQPDAYIAPPITPPPKRYCAVTTNIAGNPKTLQNTWVDDHTCCLAQKNFDTAVKVAYVPPPNRSRTDALQRTVWPIHIFFLLTLIAISIVLAFRRKLIEEVYPEHSRDIDRGVMIGGAAMVALPIMHNGFLLTTSLLHGDDGTVSLHREPETFTMAFGLWGLLIILSFMHPAHKQAESMSRFFGIIGSLAFAFKGDTITDYSTRLFGAGAGIYSLALMLALGLGLLTALWLWHQAEATPEKRKRTPAHTPTHTIVHPAPQTAPLAAAHDTYTDDDASDDDASYDAPHLTSYASHHAGRNPDTDDTTSEDDDDELETIPPPLPYRPEWWNSRN